MGWRRLGLLVIAGWLALLGVSWDGIANAADLDALLPEIGAPLLYAAALLILVMVVTPSCRWAYVLAGPLAIGGIATRPLVTYLNYAAGFTRSGWAVVGSVLAYGALAVAGGWLWTHKVGPWSGRQQAGAAAPGD